MQVFTDDGARIDVRVDGRGRENPIVLIHGFPLARGIWDTQADTLARAHCTIRPDLRGCGSSGISDGPYLMETLAADVAAVLDTLGIERAAIVGHSMGGYVALAFARMFVERVTHLALVCSRLAADTGERAAARRDLAGRIEREGNVEPVVDAYLPSMVAPQTREEKPEIYELARTMARKTDPLGAAALLRGMALRPAADDIAPDLDLPVVEIAGGADATLSLEEARAVAEAFPRGRLVVCPRSGHLPMLEEPERVTAALQALLSE